MRHVQHTLTPAVVHSHFRVLLMQHVPLTDSKRSVTTKQLADLLILMAATDPTPGSPNSHCESYSTGWPTVSPDSTPKNDASTDTIDPDRSIKYVESTDTQPGGQPHARGR